jgi:hypothetical protein
LLRFIIRRRGTRGYATENREISAEQPPSLPNPSSTKRPRRRPSLRVIAFEFPALRTWQFGAFRGNGGCLGMPGGAWQTQVAIGDLAFCARVLGKAAGGRYSSQRPNVAGRRHASQEKAIRRSSPFSVGSHKANSGRRIWNTGFIRRTRWRFVAAISVRRMTCVTVLCDETRECKLSPAQARN